MSRHLVAVMAVVTLVTVAGCSTLVSDGDGEQQRDPFDVPERTTATTVSERTAAVSGPDQFENGSRLASAHRFALEGQSFVLRQERVVRAPNGTVLRKDRVRGRVAANRTRYALSEEHWERDRQWIANRYWSAGADRPVVQARENSGPAGYVEYVDETGRPLRVSDVLDRDVTVRTRLVRILSATAGRNVTRVERNGTAVYVIDGEIGQEQGAWLVRNATDPAVRNVSVLAVVARQGLVERLELRYGFRAEDTHLRVVEQYQFERVGSTTVTPPAWLQYAPRSIERRTVDRDRDSVGGPQVSAQGSFWYDDNGRTTNGSADSDGVENPHPDRSVVPPAPPARRGPATSGTGRYRSSPFPPTDQRTRTG